jgi:Flp pilus assembly protein CpaB
MSFKKVRGWGALAIGLLLAIIAGVIYQQTIYRNTHLQSVVVISKPIQAFQPVTSDEVSVSKLPIASIPGNAIHDPKDVVAKNLKSMLMPGTILLSSYLATQSGDGLAVNLTNKKDPKLRVITLPGSLNVKGGYILVGDHVDIIGGLRAEKDAVGVTLASNVEVIAINKDQQQGSSTISLIVTVDQARQIETFKTASGDFEFLLRPYQGADGDKVPFHLSDVVGKENSVPYSGNNQHAKTQ